jgi:dipeptidyl aminopeptidase/acylaminoacyl peptidase
VKALEGTALGNAKVSSRVQAVIDWYGPTSFLLLDEQSTANGCRPVGRDGHTGPSSPESRLLGAPVAQRPDLVRAADPITYASRDDPPFLIEHGGADCTVPFQQSVLLRDALLPLLGSKRVWFTLLPGVGHGGPGFGSPTNLALVLDFLDRYLRRAG